MDGLEEFRYPERHISFLVQKIVVIIIPDLESPIFRRIFFRTADGAKHPSAIDGKVSSNQGDLKARKIIDLRLGSRTSSRTRSVGWTPAARVERGIPGGVDWLSGGHGLQRLLDVNTFENNHLTIKSCGWCRLCCCAVLFVGCCWIRKDAVMLVLASSRIPGLDTLEEWLNTQDF